MQHRGQSRHRDNSFITDLYLGSRDSSRRFHNAIHVGVITEVDYANAKARVQITNNYITGLLKWAQVNSHLDVEWNPPVVGEQVLVLCVSGRLENGFIVRGIYAKNDIPEGLDEKTHQLLYRDGTKIKYNLDSKRLEADINQNGSFLVKVGNSTITVNSDSITLVAGGVTATLNSSGFTVDNDIISTTNVRASNNVQDILGTMQEMRSRYNSHSHPGDSGGTTGAASPTMT